MSTFVPFNHQPASVVANATSYTVVAGKYARVVAVCPNASSTFTIDSNTALQGASNTNTTATTLETDGNNDLVVNSAGASGSAALTFTNEGQLVTESFWVPAGTVLGVTGSAYFTYELYNEFS